MQQGTHWFIITNNIIGDVKLLTATLVSNTWSMSVILWCFYLHLIYSFGINHDNKWKKDSHSTVKIKKCRYRRWHYYHVSCNIDWHWASHESFWQWHPVQIDVHNNQIVFLFFPALTGKHEGCFDKQDYKYVFNIATSQQWLNASFPLPSHRISETR